MIKKIAIKIFLVIIFFSPIKIVKSSFIYTIGLLATATSAQANDANFYYERGNKKLEASNFKSAIKDYSKALEINNNFEMAYLNRAIAKIEIKEMTSALGDLNRAIEINSQNPESYFYRGRIRSFIDYNLAKEDFNKAILIAPNYAPGYLGRGIMNLETSKEKEGCIDIMKASVLGERLPAEIAPDCTKYDTERLMMLDKSKLLGLKMALECDVKRGIRRTEKVESTFINLLFTKGRQVAYLVEWSNGANAENALNQMMRMRGENCQNNLTAEDMTKVSIFLKE